MKRKFIIYLPLLFALILVTGIYLGYKLTPVSVHPQLMNLGITKYNKLNDVVGYIEREYVDSVDKEELTREGLDHADSHYPLLLTARAVKPA